MKGTAKVKDQNEICKEICKKCCISQLADSEADKVALAIALVLKERNDPVDVVLSDLDALPTKGLA